MSNVMLWKVLAVILAVAAVIVTAQGRRPFVRATRGSIQMESENLRPSGGTCPAVSSEVPGSEDKFLQCAAPDGKQIFSAAGQKGLGYSGGGTPICNPGPIRCTARDRFRTVSGICNNVFNPLFGTANIAMRRFLAPQYADGVNAPRGGLSSATNVCSVSQVTTCQSDPTRQLPNARSVSLAFIGKTTVEDSNHSHMVMTHGQFLDHDITITPLSGNTIDCCTARRIPSFMNSRRPPISDPPSPRPECFNMQVPACSNDTAFNFTCLEFERSVPFCSAQSRRREQMNGNTAFVDGSQIYGSDTFTADMLRGDKCGQLLTSAGNLLPKVDLDPMSDGTAEGAFSAGDTRARENPLLTAVHTVYMREHNRVAKALGALADKKGLRWSCEELFQRARRVVVAQLQNVVYGQYLPAVLGPKLMDAYDLNLPQPNQCTRYNPDVDPSIRNAFATAAFRFGHTLIWGRFEARNVITKVVHNYTLSQNFFNDNEYLNTGTDDLIYGGITQDALSFDRFMTTELTQNLLVAAESNVKSDLAARNIQRGRDHGLPGYNDWRQFCGMERACSWTQRPAEINETNWSLLSKLYASPSDIDLFAAGLAETSVSGGIVGPTFGCIIAKQFQLLKAGDRFFFTHCPSDLLPMAFSPDELSAIRRRNFGDIICDNTDVPEVIPNVFLLPNNQTQATTCPDISTLKLDPFVRQ